jgi:hypothetical protein
MEEMIQRKISEGITTTLSQMQIEPRGTNGNNESNNRSRPSRNNTGCYICGKSGISQETVDKEMGRIITVITVIVIVITTTV